LLGAAGSGGFGSPWKGWEMMGDDGVSSNMGEIPEPNAGFNETIMYK